MREISLINCLKIIPDKCLSKTKLKLTPNLLSHLSLWKGGTDSYISLSLCFFFIRLPLK